MLERSDLILQEKVTDPEGIRQALGEGIDAAFARAQAASAAPDAARLRVVRVVVPIAPVPAFAWLHAQTLWPRCYWSGRDDDLEVAAVGAADACVGSPTATYDTLRLQLDRVLAQSDPEVRYFGGFRFDREAAADDGWARFGTYRFVLPRFEIRQEGDEALLACNLVLPRDRARHAEITAAVEQLAFPAFPLAGTLPLPVARTDGPDEAGWTRNIAWALAAFREGALEKVVLARKAVFDFNEPLDPMLLLQRLRAATPGCFHFCFQPEAAAAAFVGATPERLFRRSGRGVWSEAVAGTRPRGTSAQADEALGEELLHSEKDLREHAYVRISIRDNLAPLCETLHVDEQPSEMKLARGRHLYAGVRGTLREGVAGSDVMWALHPTPAVGGYPTAPALAAIRRLEPFDRGWYAGPVGWIGSEGAEFAVAIRSGLVAPRRLSLFSGAGIVEGSTAPSEWAEIEQKISDFVKVLGLA